VRSIATVFSESRDIERRWCIIGDVCHRRRSSGWAAVEHRWSSGSSIEQLQSGLFWNCHPDLANNSRTAHSATIFLVDNELWYGLFQNYHPDLENSFGTTHSVTHYQQKSKTHMTLPNPRNHLNQPQNIQ